MSSPCDACYAPCCREVHVLLSGREALRIAASLSLPLEAFTEFPFRAQPEGEFRIVLFDSASKLRRYHRMQLRQIPTPFESYQKRCYFLTMQGATARCGCYPVRPRPCIAFPYQEHGAAVKLSRFEKAWCPPGAWANAPVDVPAHHLLRREQEADREIYRAVIDTWNDSFFEESTRFEVTQFLAYLKLAYQSLEGLTASRFAESQRLGQKELARIYDAALTALRAQRLASDQG